jgi:GntR family transcriptional repressor for pyruvate dehydrogenase complex
MNKQKQELIKAIYSRLESGEIVRDDQLFSERELCEIFGVKRSVLREALISLETLGIIDIRERQGMFLVKGTLKSLADGLDFLHGFSPLVIHDKSMEVRLMIEPVAAGLAASNRTERHCRILREEIAFLDKVNKSTDKSSKAVLGACCLLGALEQIDQELLHVVVR